MPWNNKTTVDLAGRARRLSSLTGAAEYAEVCAKTVRRWIAAGDLPAYRHGRVLRVDLNDIDALLQPIPTVAQSGGAA